MIPVICDICQTHFKVPVNAKNPVSCKLCQAALDVPELRQRDLDVEMAAPKCPGCGKALAVRVKFCVSCGTGTGDIWAAPAAAFEAKENLKERVWWRRLKDWFRRW